MERKEWKQVRIKPGRIKKTYVLIRAGIEKKQCYTGDDDHILAMYAGSSQEEKERRASSC